MRVIERGHPEISGTGEAAHHLLVPWSGSKRIHPFPLRANSLGGEAYRSNEPVNTNLPMELAFFMREVSPGSDTN